MPHGFQLLCALLHPPQRRCVNTHASQPGLARRQLGQNRVSLVWQQQMPHPSTPVVGIKLRPETATVRLFVQWVGCPCCVLCVCRRPVAIRVLAVTGAGTIGWVPPELERDGGNQSLEGNVAFHLNSHHAHQYVDIQSPVPVR